MTQRCQLLDIKLISILYLIIRFSGVFVNNELEIDVSSFSEGIYLLQMQTGKGRKRTKKFIVSK